MSSPTPQVKKLNNSPAHGLIAHVWKILCKLENLISGQGAVDHTKLVTLQLRWTEKVGHDFCLATHIGLYLVLAVLLM